MSHVRNDIYAKTLAETAQGSLATNTVSDVRTIATPEQRDARGRLGGIDSVRALAACVVVFGHLGLFADSALHSKHTILRDTARVSDFTWNGPASVIVFFVISGFCIHLPFRGSRPLHMVPFLLRRMLRIGVPALAALCIARYVVHDLQGLDNVIWSILCEAIYYLLYPAILPLGRRVGWLALIGGSYAISLALALTHLHQLQAGSNGYVALGSSLTWLIGLPCWLLGCWLAENERRFPKLSSGQMALLRVGLFSSMVGLRIVKFHVHSPFASNCITLNLFAVIACLWLGFEVAYFKQVQAPSILEWMGEWSYSLYLMHPMATALLFSLSLSAAIARSDSLHLLLVAFAFVLAYAFHLLFERPSHKLAVALSRSFAK